MTNSDKIQSASEKIATEASASLRHFLEKDAIVIKTDLIKRASLNLQREEKRPEIDKIILATERIVRGSDQSETKPPSPSAQKAGAPVARLYEISAINEPKGFGTGFLVAPNILITNHHVFENPSAAENCIANFNYEIDNSSGAINNGILYKLRPDIFFFNYEALDFALVYVEENSIESGIKLSTLGLLPLIETKGKITVGGRMNIIQYPQGGVKKYTTKDNAIINVDDEKGIIYYYTDTQIGASGSPGLNDYWEVAALHYTGVPDTNKEGQWLTKDGQIWDKNTMKEDDIKWIANAGKSVSKIVQHLKSVNLNDDHQKYVDTILINTKDPLNNNLPTESNKLTPVTKKSNSTEGLIMNFYGNTNVYVNQIAALSEVPGISVDQYGMHELTIEKKERFDENYDNRKGYSEEFIPGFRVPMPRVVKDKEVELYKKFGSSKPYIIPYHHFSLVMNKKRRMAMWTASNVDYNRKFRDGRERQDLGNGAWRLDKRVPEKYQIQANEFYDPATLIDKGHLVRRDDNCWALLKNNKTDSIGIEYANADTFHWSNCTPQHEAFNRDVAQYTGIGKWGVLENAIKQQLEFPENDPDNGNKDYGQRACVFCGPILSDNDPEYMDIQYPLKFWKVFAINSASVGRLVYGFMLSQADKIEEEGLEKEGVPRFNRMVKAMQVSLADIEEESGIQFDKDLHDYDVKAGDGPEDLDDDLRNLKLRKKLSEAL